MMASVKLVTLYNGRPTFVHPGVSDSVLDVTFASPVSRLRVLWCLEAEPWGRNHLSIRLIPTRSRHSIVRSHRGTSWNVYHQRLDELQKHGVCLDLFSGICDVLDHATRKIVVLSKCPVPYLKYLNLRATWRKA